MTLNAPRPVILHPEQTWSLPKRVALTDWTRWARGRAEAINANAEIGVVQWWTPGFTLTILSDADMDRARAFARETGSEARVQVLEAAWALAKGRLA